MATSTASSSSTSTGGSDWAVTLLGFLHVPVTSNNVNKLHAWEQAEGGLSVEHANNPFNTTLNSSSYPHVPGTSVPIYPDLQTGLKMTAATIIEPQYGSIRYNLATSGDPGRFISDVGNSPWGTNLETLAKVMHLAPAPTDPNPYTGQAGGQLPKGADTTTHAAAGGVVSGVEGAAKSVSSAIGFVFSSRFVFLVSGALLVGMGLLVLARAAGASSATAPVRAAAKVAAG